MVNFDGFKFADFVLLPNQNRRNQNFFRVDSTSQDTNVLAMTELIFGIVSQLPNPPNP